MNRVFAIMFIALFTVLTLQIVSACASNIEFHYEIVDNDLVPYVNVYKQLLKDYCPNNKYNQSHHYIIELTDEPLENEWIGVCRRKSIGYKIQIDKEFWEKADKQEKQQLIDHEMSHCLIDQEHSPDPGNYMFYQFPYLDSHTVNEQVIKNIKTHCSE